MVPEGHPLGRCARGLIEVLMLAAVGLHRQDDQVPFLPIYLLPVHRCISLAFQDKQLDSPLMPVFPRMGFDVLNKTGPALRCRFQYCSVGHLVPVEVPLGIPLPPLAPREILGANNNFTVLGMQFLDRIGFGRSNRTTSLLPHLRRSNLGPLVPPLVRGRKG